VAEAAGQLQGIGHHRSQIAVGLQLEDLPPDMGVQNLTSKGFIQSDGRFNSDTGQAMGVLGAIAYAGGQQAGYVFQQTLDATKTLSGATLWVR